MSNSTNPSEAAPMRRRRAHAASRGGLWSAVGVALAAAGVAPSRARAPASAVERLRHVVRVGAPPGTALSYLRSGDASAPRVILVHGTPGSASVWSDYLLHRPLPFDLVALDRPGFGRSGPAAALPGLEEQAAAVAALLPGDGRAAVLLGHSLGGAVVAQVAARHPSRIAGIVLLAAALDPALERIHPLQRAGQWPPLRGLLPRAIRNANAELMTLRAELEALAVLLPRITSKVVIVHGTKDDLVPVANVAYMQSRLTGARCVETRLLEGRNHFLPWNSMAAVTDALHRVMEPAC